MTGLTINGYDAIVAAMKDVIPDTIEKEYLKIQKSGDQVKMQEFYVSNIKPIVDSYLASMTNFNFQPGEQIQWINEIKKGIIHREVIQRWIITNLRAMMVNPPLDGKPQRMTSVGLAISEPVILNQRRVSNGSHVGVYAGRGVGSFTGSSSSTSRTYGDLVFYLQGKEVLRFPGISDPSGVKRMIITLKKQTKV